MAAPTFSIEALAHGESRLRLLGQWSLRAGGDHFEGLQEKLTPWFNDASTHWDLTSTEQLDSAGAALLWRGWGNQVHPNCVLREEHIALFATLKKLPSPQQSHPSISSASWLETAWQMWLEFIIHLMDFVTLMGSLTQEIVHLVRRPSDIPWKEISANIYKGGVMALPVTALVGCMIGVAMSYLMALQLRKFGADIFIINILGMAIVRELGPILMSVLVAGRSGSAMTAQIGVMRVTEEIDALATMGVSRTLRLILPKVIGLTLVSPLLLFWTSAWALLGGMVVAYLQLGIGFDFFMDHLPRVVKPVNLILASVKGITFGLLVALIACHFGLRVKPNTESLSSSTTSSVVASITCVILADAMFAIATRSIGI
jgi:phospholipid/cholesterol/gamma-HCH transport system permease protein